MKNSIKYIVITALMLVGGNAMATEEPAYKIIKQAGELEVRDYPAQLTAHVTLKAAEGSRNDAFRILADYIFGGNTAQEKIGMTAPEKIGMTAPVRITESGPLDNFKDRKGEKIGMTAPVKITENDAEVHMVFYMPTRYTSSTIPAPKDARIKLVEEPAMRVGVAKFSWWFTDAKFAEYSAKLSTWLQAEECTPVAAPTKQYFNAPFTLPFMRRNEVWIVVK